MFRDWLQAHHPLRAEHIMSQVRQMRGGRENDASFGTRQRGTGVFAQLLDRRFAAACRRHGLQGGLPDLDGSRFRPPAADQLPLF